MYFPYGTSPGAGQPSFRPAICTNVGYPFNPYQPPFYPKSHGLLPTPTQGFIPSRPLIATLMDKSPTVDVRSIPTLPLKSPLSALQSLMAQENERKIETSDASPLLQEKNKSNSELNPFASEFSLGKSDPEVPQSTIESAPTFKLILNELVEKSLQSIEAIGRASRSVSLDCCSLILAQRF